MKPWTTGNPPPPTPSPQTHHHHQNKNVQGPLLIELDLLKPLLDHMGLKFHLWSACIGAKLDEYNSIILDDRVIPSSDIILKVTGLSTDLPEKITALLPLRQIFLAQEDSEALPTLQTYTFFKQRKKPSPVGETPHPEALPPAAPTAPAVSSASSRKRGSSAMEG